MPYSRSNIRVGFRQLKNVREITRLSLYTAYQIHLSPFDMFLYSVIGCLFCVTREENVTPSLVLYISLRLETLYLT